MGPCPLLLKKLKFAKIPIKQKINKSGWLVITKRVFLSPAKCFRVNDSECVCVLSWVCACLGVSAIMCVCACLDVSAPVQERGRSVGERKEKKRGEKDANVLK